MSLIGKLGDPNPGPTVTTVELCVIRVVHDGVVDEVKFVGHGVQGSDVGNHFVVDRVLAADTVVSGGGHARRDHLRRLLGALLGCGSAFDLANDHAVIDFPRALLAPRARDHDGGVGL